MSLRDTARAMYDRAVLPRAYHNWAHVEACLVELESARSICDRADLIEIALWFHDCVYDPRRGDNEARSADEAERAMRANSAGESDIAVVRELILDTKHNHIPSNNDGQIIVDIDLTILGQPDDVFAEYERAIRAEYAFVGDADFSSGRAAVLRGFLARPSIYGTQFFRDRYERAARTNLTAAVARWTS
jgi:predicted metal-dependent HD superfamily phosphohydrolase